MVTRASRARLPWFPRRPVTAHQALSRRQPGNVPPVRALLRAELPGCAAFVCRARHGRQQAERSERLLFHLYVPELSTFRHVHHACGGLQFVGGGVRFPALAFILFLLRDLCANLFGLAADALVGV